MAVHHPVGTVDPGDGGDPIAVGIAVNDPADGWSDHADVYVDGLSWWRHLDPTDAGRVAALISQAIQRAQQHNDARTTPALDDRSGDA